MAATTGQRILGEFLGTFGLLLSVTGAALLTIPGATSFDPLVRVLIISLSIGAGLVGLLYAFADLSGGHFNPAVTVGLWVAGRFPGRDVVPYILAQLAGGVLAVAMIAGVAHGSPPLWNGAVSAAFASQGYSGNGAPYTVLWTSVFLLEALITFVLVVVILFSTRPESTAHNLAPIGIGLTLMMLNLVAIPVDGASANPARSFAPAILAAFFHGDQWAIHQNWLFWIAPIGGAMIAALVARALEPRTA